MGSNSKISTVNKNLSKWIMNLNRGLLKKGRKLKICLIMKVVRLAEELMVTFTKQKAKTGRSINVRSKLIDS